MVREAINEYTPDVVSPPGETLQELLDERGMSQAELAERMGRPKKTINEIIKGKTAITPETALQLERVLGVPAGFWTNMEKHYREHLARQEEMALLEGSVEWLREMPVAALKKLGWIEARKNKAEQVREMLSFFGVASPEQWRQVFSAPQAAFRHSSAYKSEPGALSAWLRKGELRAQEIVCEPFDKSKFEEALLDARKLTIEPPSVFQPRLVELCAAAGVAVAFVPELPKCRAHGATRWLSATKAVIQLSLRYKTDDHLWFTFFHEAGHVLLHGKKQVFIESDKGAPDREEAEANEFAASLLIPQDSLARLQSFAERQRISNAQVIGLAEELGIAPGIVVGRLQHIGWLPYTHLNGLKTRLMWATDGE
jgi:addiction module HigA family antidote